MVISSSERTGKRERKKSIKKTSEGAVVAKEQGLPLGWTAERRSGGHYVVYSSSGERFTSINAARQAARAEVETPSWKRALSAPVQQQASQQQQSSKIHPATPVVQRQSVVKQSLEKDDDDEYFDIDQSLEAHTASLPNIGEKGVDPESLYSVCYLPPEFDPDDLLSSLDIELQKKYQELNARVKHVKILSNWRRGERLEACYRAMFEAKFEPTEAASIFVSRAALRKKRDAAFSQVEANEAARLIESMKKDLPQVAASLGRPLGELLAWYYREYKHYFRRKRAPWPSNTTYSAVKKMLQKNNASPVSTLAGSSTTCIKKTTNAVPPRFTPGRIRTPIYVASAHRKNSPRVPMPREVPPDEDSDDIEQDVMIKPRERITQSRREPSAKPFDPARYTPGTEIISTKRPQRPKRADPAMTRLTGVTYQGLDGALWYVTKAGDTIRSVATERSLCPRQLAFINARMVSVEADEDKLDDDALDTDLGQCLALLLPQIVSPTALSAPPIRKLSKLCGGEVLAVPPSSNIGSNSRRCWYIARAGETLAAVALCLVGANLCPPPVTTPSSSKKKQPPPPRLGPRANIDDKEKKNIVDALFREQLAWLAYEDAKQIFTGSLEDKTPLLLPNHAPWPILPDDRQYDETKLEVLGVAPPLLDSDDASALLRGEIVIEKDTKRRWAAVLVPVSPALGTSTTTEKPLVGQCPNTKQKLLTFGDDNERSILPRSLRSAARTLGVEESELRRLNATLTGLDGPAERKNTKVAMLLLPEPLRPACTNCRISRISNWVCRSELKHTAPSSDKSPASGWQAGTRLKLQAQVSRSCLELTPTADHFREVQENCKVWLDATLMADVSSSNELHVQAQAPDYRDGTIIDNTLSPLCIKWPSSRVVPITAEKSKDMDTALLKVSKFLIGRSLDSWGEGPPLTQITNHNIPRWRVVSVYRSADENLRVSGEDDVVALLEPESRDLLERQIPNFSTNTEIQLTGQVDMSRSYARCAVSHLLATGCGWRPCARCVVDGCADSVRCRHVLRHDDPDSDALPKLGGPVRLRLDTEWLYGIAAAVRPPRGDWKPDVDLSTLIRLPEYSTVTNDSIGLAVQVEGTSLDRLSPILGNKIDSSVLLSLVWPDSRRLVSSVVNNVHLSRSPTPEQRGLAGRIWRRKSDDFSKLRAAVSRNDISRGDARLRLVIEVFESFAEGLDGICVRHSSAQYRCASMARMRAESTVTRLDAWHEAMLPADTLGAALSWQPTALFDSTTNDDEEIPRTFNHPIKPGDVIEMNGNSCYYVCRGGETMAFIAEWTASDVAQLRHANRRLLKSRESDSSKKIATKKSSTPAASSTSKKKTTTSKATSPSPENVSVTSSKNDEDYEDKKGKGKRRRTETAKVKEKGKKQKSISDVGSKSCMNDEVFQSGDVVRIACGPVKRLIPPMDAVRGDRALACGEFIDAGNEGAIWYSCKENDNCEQVAKCFGLSDGNEIVAANRHRHSVRTITKRSQLSRWTVLLVPRTNLKSDEKAHNLQKRKKPCAKCLINGERSTRVCRDTHGHVNAPDFDDLSAAAPSPSSVVGARVRVRWLDEETGSAQWLFATVTSVSPNFKVTYEDGIVDDMEWPNSDAVAIPRNSPTRPMITPEHEALVGQTFEWKKGKDRWLVTDVFDSYDEGVDTLVAMIKPFTSDDTAQGEETFETIEDLLVAATDWMPSSVTRANHSPSSPAKSASSKRRRSESSSESHRNVKQVTTQSSSNGPVLNATSDIEYSDGGSVLS